MNLSTWAIEGPGGEREGRATYHVTLSKYLLFWDAVAKCVLKVCRSVFPS
jgi:hypothetical protein